MTRTKFVPCSRYLLPAEVACAIGGGERYAIISINEVEGGDAVSPVSPEMRKQSTGVLTLNFSDTPVWVPDGEKVRVFTPEMAVTIWSFVEAISAHTDMFLVHCHAGVSRSPAICAALSLYYLREAGMYLENYHPNRHVLKTMWANRPAKGSETASITSTANALL